MLPKDFEQLGLFIILQNRVAELNCITNLRFYLVTDGCDKVISELVTITLYRIINELVNNILKYAQASIVNLQLAISLTDIILIIEDNGTPINQANHKHGIGLKNIYSRVDFLKGKITIDSNSNGTFTIIDIPYRFQFDAGN